MTHVIVCTRQWYGPRETVSLVVGPDDTVRQFIDRARAERYIERLSSHPYYLAHNESSAPDYRVERIADLEEYLADQIEPC